MVTPVNPANGPIWINNRYFGDAIFTSGLGISTITRKLAEKLELTFVTGMTNDRSCPMVIPKVTLGTNNFEIEIPMFIYEDYFQVPEELSFAPHEIYLGNDFMHQMKLLLTLGSSTLAKSKFFGTVPSGFMRKFVKKYVEGNTYGSVEDNRVILLFDMDCFEVQVHEQPHQKGKPRVVVNSYDRVLAVSYEAKLLGINREATPHLSQARQKCQELIPIYVPTVKNTTGGPARPDSSVAREATARIVNAIRTALAELGNQAVFEFSSNDEFFVDLTEVVNSYDFDGIVYQVGPLWPSTFLYNGTVIGKPSADYVGKRVNVLQRKQNLSRLEIQEARLIFGSTIANIIVQKILMQTTYQSSVGIGSNKLISKVGSGMHKPGSITILAPSGFEDFTQFIKAKDIPGLGGKLGHQIRQQFFEEPTIWDLRNLSDDQLAAISDGSGPIGLSKANAILFSANGICDKKVVPATCYHTSGISRRFFGKCFTENEMHNILLELVEEFMRKMEFEARVNSRSPENVNMNIRCLLRGARSNLLSNFKTQGEIASAFYLFQMLLENCTPQLTLWNPESKVDSVHITATF